MKHFNHQVAKSNTILIIVLLIMTTGIISIIYQPTIEEQAELRWELLDAQQASLNTLVIAKNMLKSNRLNSDCLNTAKCPFWTGYPNIRLTNKNGSPNISWWEKNAYAINGSLNNAKFIIIKMPNNLYKIIAYAEDYKANKAIISLGYF